MAIITDDLSDRQYRVLSFIIEHQKKHGMAPTVREIGKKVGLNSPAGVHRILKLLKSKGYLKSKPTKNRAWRFSGAIPESGIPLMGAIAAGGPIEALNYVEEELAVSPSIFGSDNCFALRVKGDSMVDAHIVEGDLAIIRPNVHAENGEIAAVLVENLLTEATLKIIRRFRHTLTLLPANRANRNYKPMSFTGNERKQVSIIGKMVGIIRVG
jgi:repressor LexA